MNCYKSLVSTWKPHGNLVPAHIMAFPPFGPVTSMAECSTVVCNILGMSFCTQASQHLHISSFFACCGTVWWIAETLYSQDDKPGSSFHFEYKSSCLVSIVLQHKTHFLDVWGQWSPLSANTCNSIQVLTMHMFASQAGEQHRCCHPLWVSLHDAE